MNIRNFTVPGFARFYRSLLRFNRDMEVDYALRLTYSFYTAVNDAYLYKNPDACIAEYSEHDFFDMLQKTGKKPYKTIIQLYRALESLYLGLSPALDTLKFRQLSDFMTISLMMDDMEIRFHKAFNMEIDDDRTVYGMCARSLISRRDEPGLCLMKDWMDAVSVSA